MEIQDEGNVKRGVFSCLKTVGIAVLTTAVLMCVLAVLICITPLPEEAVTPSVYVLNYFSVFLAGLFSAAKGRKKGFLTGACAGGLYMLLVYAIGYALFGGISFTTDTALQIFYCVLVGMIGGVVGINLIRK